MKKIATLLVFVCLAAGVYAQHISVGAKLGLNLANQKYKGDYGNNFIAAFHVGGYLTYMFSERLGIQPELLYTGQGAKHGDSKTKTSYIAMPIMVRYNVNSLLSFHAGPQIAILTSAKNVNDGNTSDIKDQFSSTDFGIGLGMTISVKKFNFTARYIQGLSNINANPDVTVERNVTFQQSVAFTIFGGND